MVPLKARPGLAAALAGTALCLPLSAQELGNDWVSFVPGPARLVSAPELGADDPEEKDYAWADLDRDGWVDLVCVRKEGWSTPGARRNVLFRNESGVLVDRTVEYASAADVTGDQGFLTPTNDRDVAIADVDGDGWLDVVTATAQSAGWPKHVSHPRVYRNLGSGPSGTWRGLRYEEGRFPQLQTTAGVPTSPRFSAVAAGDLTGDGRPELYFADYDTGPGGGLDLNDRLLVNDGTGSFTDESSLRMTTQMLLSAMGTSAAIEDLNGDGLLDVVKDSALSSPIHVAASYNDPANPGYFATFDDFHHLSPYYVAVGDLNRDGRPDAVLAEAGVDRVRYNLATAPDGRAVWGPARPFELLWGGDDGFGGNVVLADLDGDGWRDVWIADVDVDVPGCQRRAHLYHNPGGQAGDEIVLREEAEAAGPDGWKGAAGLTAEDLRGVHDVAVFDLDRDGDLDLVLGRCSGTDVWLQAPIPGVAIGSAFCACDGSGSPPPCGNPGAAGEGCANSTGLGGALLATGSASTSADDLGLAAGGLVPDQPALAFVGDEPLAGGDGAPFGDGLRCVGGSLVRLGVAAADGGGAADWGHVPAAAGGWLAGQTRYFQAWYRDPLGGPCGAGFNLTQGVAILFLP